MPSETILLFASQITGFVLLVSTMILVGMRRIYIDKETKQPIEFEFPLLGKMKTQSPVLFIIAAGVLLVLYPLGKGGPDQATIEGQISAQGKPVTVSVLAVPQQFQTTVDASGGKGDSSGRFSMNVPLLPQTTYRIKFEADRQIFAEQSGTLTKRTISLTPVEYVPVAPLDTQPVKGVSDDFVAKIGIR